ncbi:MAG: hypothetical protein NTZ95_07305 [Candidatus Omnitrophica bacterium]|nr:hypothetical protein [Candidatus Omnitrophota bacterium]
MENRLAVRGFRLAAATILISLVATASFAAERNVVKIGSDVLVERGTTVNDIVVIDGNVVVSGNVDGNIVVIGGSLKLCPGVRVGQQVVLIGAGIDRDPSAAIGGKITEVGIPSSIPFVPSLKSFFKGGWIVTWAAISIMVLLGFLGLAVLVAALVPEHMGTVVHALERSFASMFLWGILGAFLAGLVLVLLAITIVGIILIPLAIVAITLAWIIGYIASAIFIGKNVMAYFKKSSLPFVNAVLGIVLLFLAGFLPLVGPFVIKPIFLFAGFGAVLTTRFGTVK